MNLEGLKLVSEDLGDIYPRKIQYDPLSGRARMKKLRTMHNKTVAEREEAYMQQIDETPSSGDIELFWLVFFVSVGREIFIVLLT